MMDKAVRWLKALFGGKKAGFGAPPPAEEPKPVKTKRRWSFGKSMRERDQKTAMDATAAAVAAERRKGLCREVPSVAAVEVDKENKRAIAVAAATAAVAEAAVAAAQAAAVVVKLTSSGRDVGAVAFSGLKRVEWAAVKIQATFRGYLARRALRALRGLVKLQALVRGNIVRKQAAETLRCMQALVRVQARARACRALRAEKAQLCKGGSQPAPPTPEKSESPFRSNSLKPVRSGSFKRNSSETPNSEAVEQDRVRHSGWHWLDRWMEERNRGGQESIDISGVVAAATDDDRSTKILEIDKGKLQFNVERWGSSNQIRSSGCSTLASDQNSRSFITVPGSPSKESTAAQHSISSPPSVDVQQLLRPLEPGDLDDSPPYYCTASRPGSSSRRGPFTPSKSECSRSLFSVYSDCPNYMANTESSRAKVRSQSAPKQRPPELDKSSSIKRVSVHQQNSSVLADKSSSLHAKFANKAYPGSGRLDRLGLPMRI